MANYAIIEIEAGFEVIDLLPGQSAEDAAAAQGGALVDPGPYHSFEDANDALDQLEVVEDED
ncbi:hypothetical protein Mal15_06510 [Stieleria maiorica]|uniref:Uncharacterized protein n=1 Tax=Stieleria maiorica TaxID=2795974 RepID=A0A5B9M7I2_9BACT|nr:hypothetical protein [Stieleria maiorica]QEF96623.1 hypothetical protein Mal15_06510 [Stieleria maiorica]